MPTPIADKFYADAKDAPVERRGQIIAQAYSTIVELEQDAARLNWCEAQWCDGLHIESCGVSPGGNAEPHKVATVFFGRRECQAKTIRAAIDAAISQSQPDHPFSGSSGND